METEMPLKVGERVPQPTVDLTTNTWTEKERADTVRWYELAHGTGDTRFIQMVPFMIEYNPAGFKRWRALVPALTGAVPRGLFLLHMYAATGNAQGTLYETVTCRLNGNFTKKQIIETLNFAFFAAGPPGGNSIAENMSMYLASWEDDRDNVITWPEGWVIDPDRFRSGIDHTTIGFTEPELVGLKDWHMALTGEVPRFVDTWARLRGAAYKANRARFEVTPGTTIPVQAYPLMSMLLAAYQERIPALRRALLICRHLGVKLQQVVEVLDLAFQYEGEQKMACVLTDEIIDLLEAWPADATDPQR
jgi:hypothetical protein